ncbi:MAG: YhbY family RNA-binding protein [Betaproteobacteria bacterium]|nr:YhbY family RNA-binding protein [Betaproteobacteria bacterium]
MSELLPPARRALRARAHHLQPVVAIGQHGLTPAVLHEIDVALLKHELIKVRVASEQRATRDALLSLICKEIECAAVQHLGRIFILYRENPGAAKTVAAKPDTRSVKKTRAGKSVKLKTGARTPLDPVRERRRATQAGLPVSGKGRRGAARHQSSDAVTAKLSGPGFSARGQKKDPSTGTSTGQPTVKGRKASVGANVKSQRPRTETKSKSHGTTSPVRRHR